MPFYRMKSNPGEQRTTLPGMDSNQRSGKKKGGGTHESGWENFSPARSVFSESDLTPAVADARGAVAGSDKEEGEGGRRGGCGCTGPLPVVEGSKARKHRHVTRRRTTFGAEFKEEGGESPSRPRH